MKKMRSRRPESLRRWGAALCLALLAAVIPTIASSVEPDWRIYLPTNTGIQGNYANSILVDPRDGAIWIAAYNEIWQEGGLARFNGTSWTNWSNADGTCPTHELRRMAWDLDGNIWAGSDIGLVKFDGQSFTVFNTQNAPLVVNRVADVAVDEQGSVWFAMNDFNQNQGGLGRFDGTSWTIWTRASGIPWPSPWNGVSCVAPGPGGVVYIGSDVVGAARFDGTSWTYYDPFGPNAPPSNFLNDIEVEADGTAWFSSPNDAMGRLSGTTWTYYNPPGTGVAFLRLGQPGVVYAGTFDAGVQRLFNDQWTPYGWIGTHVYGIAIAEDASLWAAGIGGAGHYENGVWTEYDVANTGLTERWIDGIAHDDAGDHWIATSGGGICRFDGEVWLDFNPYNHGNPHWPYNTDAINAVRQMQNGEIWAGLRNTGIGTWNGTAWSSPPQLPNIDVRGITEDTAGRAWAATENGLAVRNGTTWSMYTTGNSVLQSNDVRAVAADGQGRVWAGGFGLVHTDGTNWTLYTNTNSPLPGNWVDALAVGPDGAVWIGTDDGLARFHNGVWTVYNAANSPLPADPITAIAITPDNVVWSGCFDVQTWPYPGGLVRYEAGTWQVFTTANSPLPHNQIWSIGIDADRNPWIGTASEGIAVYYENIPAGLDEEPSLAGDSQARLLPIAPNPFSGETLVRLELPRGATLDIGVFDASGRRVASLASGARPAGAHVLTWDGRRADGAPASSGAYFVRMRAGEMMETRKVILAR